MYCRRLYPCYYPRSIKERVTVLTSLEYQSIEVFAVKGVATVCQQFHDASCSMCDRSRSDQVASFVSRQYRKYRKLKLRSTVSRWNAVAVSLNEVKPSPSVSVLTP